MKRIKHLTTLDYILLPEDTKTLKVPPSKSGPDCFNDAAKKTEVTHFGGSNTQFEKYSYSPAGMIEILVRRCRGPLIVLTETSAVNVWPRWNMN